MKLYIKLLFVFFILLIAFFVIKPDTIKSKYNVVVTIEVDSLTLDQASKLESELND